MMWARCRRETDGEDAVAVERKDEVCQLVLCSGMAGPAEWARGRGRAERGGESYGGRQRTGDWTKAAIARRPCGGGVLCSVGDCRTQQIIGRRLHVGHGESCVLHMIRISMLRPIHRVLSHVQ